MKEEKNKKQNQNNKFTSTQLTTAVRSQWLQKKPKKQQQHTHTHTEKKNIFLFIFYQLIFTKIILDYNMNATA